MGCEHATAADPSALPVVHRTARCGLRVTRAQRRRLTGLLVSAGDVWCAVLELNAWRRARQHPPLAGYQELCRELARAGPGTFGELDSVGARSVLRRYSGAWMAAAKTLITWAVGQRIGTLAVGDPRGVLTLDAGRRHNQRVRDWRIGHLLAALTDKAQAAGICVQLVDERGTSSTCPACARRIPKPAGRILSCPHCGHCGHRDLSAAANIAARIGGGTTPAIIPAGVTHRRAGTHLPGVSPARRDPRRRAHHRYARRSPGPHRSAPPSPHPGPGRGVARLPGEEPEIHTRIYRQMH